MSAGKQQLATLMRQQQQQNDGHRWNGTFEFLRPTWRTLTEFLERCSEFEAPEPPLDGDEAPDALMRNVLAVTSFPGPTFARAAEALVAHERVSKTRQAAPPHKCIPWSPASALPYPQLQTQLGYPESMVPQRPPKIAVVTLCTANMRNISAAMLALADKQEYCDRHGYDFHAISETVEGRAAAWAKLPGILSLLPRYDWIVSLDLDTVIYDHGIRLEEFADPHHDMVVGLDYNGINSGVFFLRNTTWSKVLLMEAWTITEEPMSYIWWEQSALMRLLKNEGIRNHVKYCPQMYFNSYMTGNQEVPAEENGGRGPFILHFAGVGTKWELLPTFHARRKNVKVN